MAEFRVEELARRADASVDTIRFYQKRGLLMPPRREGRVARGWGLPQTRVWVRAIGGARRRPWERPGLDERQLIRRLSVFGRAARGRLEQRELGDCRVIAGRAAPMRVEPALPEWGDSPDAVVAAVEATTLG